MRLELYPFRFRSSVTGKWVKARYVASRDDIAARHAEFNITAALRPRVAALYWVGPHR
jgi:hypothetical protein